MNIYVGNLDYKFSDDDLKELFEEFGTVDSANVIKDRDTGRSKGFGFVEMANDAEAEEAIEELDGAEVDGRTIKVNKAKPKSSGGGGGGKRGGGRYNR
ncbi:MAG: RNA recognition motif domain-containing protein [Balneolaceae bacterium]